MKSIAKMTAAALLAVPLIQGCSSDSSQDAGQDASADSDNSSSSSTGTNSSTGGSSSSEATSVSYNTAAKFRLPTTAEIQEQFGDDLALLGGATDCEGDYATGVARCVWSVPSAPLRDGVATVEVNCDDRDGDYNTFIAGRVDADRDATAVTDLGVPAVISRHTSNRQQALLGLLFKVESQAQLRYCTLSADGMWDNSASTFRPVDVDAAAEDLQTLAKKLIS